MSDVSQGPGWWQASDGKWYPPKDADKAPAPGWWLASDGKWYPPVESEQPPQPGWWLAADGKWYPPATAETEGQPAGAAAAAKPAPAKPAPAKPVPAKPVAAKPVPAKPAAAKPTPAKAAGAKPTPAKAAGGKPTPAKPAAAKPAPAKPTGTNRPPATSASPAAAPPREGGDVRRSGFGLSPEEQIRIRNEQSKRDAVALAAKRSMAATRALSTLQGMIDEEKASQSGQDLHESRALRNQPATPPAAKPAPPAKAAAKSAPAPKPPSPAPAAKQAAPASPPPPPATPAKADAEPRVPSTDSPLLEVKQSPLHSDIDHLGERLVIFTDRVELHDRNDRVRETIFGPDIADVVVHKKFTGSTVTVESGTGVTIVAKGLKPDQAEEIRTLILKRTRQGTASAAGDAEPAKPAGTGKPGAAAKPAAPKSASSRGTGRNRVNQEELLAKLTDLHRAGVLTDDELEEKKALVARLARGESLASTSATPR